MQEAVTIMLPKCYPSGQTAAFGPVAILYLEREKLDRNKQIRNTGEPRKPLQVSLDVFRYL